MSDSLIFLKLGGSLITEKGGVSKPRPDAIKRLVNEIASARKSNPQMRVLLGNGSGSFGHVPAKKHNTRTGVLTPDQWVGFVEVWQQAAALNRIVMDALQAAGLPAIAFPPSASIAAHGGNIKKWNVSPILAALEASLLPVVYGDVAFDSERGGTILSTEDLFAHLATQLHPQRILLAGDEAGIYADYPVRKILLAEITPSNFAEYEDALSGAAVTDVTGGMAGKASAMLDLIKDLPDCEVQIFSGLEPGNLQKAINGERFGTLLHSK